MHIYITNHYSKEIVLLHTSSSATGIISFLLHVFLLSPTFLFCWYFLRRVLLYYGYDNLIGEDIDI